MIERRSNKRELRQGALPRIAHAGHKSEISQHARLTRYNSVKRGEHAPIVHAVSQRVATAPAHVQFEERLSFTLVRFPHQRWRLGATDVGVPRSF